MTKIHIWDIIELKHKDVRKDCLKKGRIFMKKTLALVLAVVLCAACFAFASSAADALSFLPEADSEVAAEGCEYVINDDGSVTITLTAASAKLTVIYKDVVENTIYEEKEVNDHGIREVRRLAQVNSALCQGCGACTVACPSGAMDLQGFSNRQIIAEVDAICR